MIRFSSVEEDRLGGGFPCVHLPSVRSDSQNSGGDGSNFFFRLVEIRDLLIFS